MAFCRWPFVFGGGKSFVNVVSKWPASYWLDSEATTPRSPGGHYIETFYWYQIYYIVSYVNIICLRRGVPKCPLVILWESTIEDMSPVYHGGNLLFIVKSDFYDLYVKFNDNQAYLGYEIMMV